MRWIEIIVESDDVLHNARQFIMDMISPLRSQGVNSITVQQILDQMDSNPDFSGIATDAGFVMAAMKGVPKIKIERDGENGEMSLFVQDVPASRQVDAEQAEKDKKTINKAALRTIDKKRKA